MRFSADKSALLPALKAANLLATERTTIPILGCVKIETQDSALLISATDMDRFFEVGCPAVISLPGAICIPGAKILAFVTGSPDGASIEIEDSGKGNIAARAGRTNAHFTARSSDEFPAWNHKIISQTVSIAAEQIFELIGGVRFAVSDGDKTRPTLWFAHITMNGAGFVEISATNGHIASKARLAIGHDGAPLESLLPPAAMDILPRIFSEKDTIEISWVDSGRLVRFSANGKSLLTKTGDYTFPDLSRVWPDAQNRRCINQKEISGAVGRAAALNPQSHAVVLNFNGHLEVSCSHPDWGDYREDIEYSGDDTAARAGFNSHYLRDALNRFSCETLEFYGSREEGAPWLICERGADPRSDGVVIMPMRV